MPTGIAKHWIAQIKTSRVWTCGLSRRLIGAGLMQLLLCAATIVLLRAPVAATELISVGIRGTSGNAPSNGVATNADGSAVAFYSDATDLVPGDTNQARDVFVRDRVHTTTERISVNSSGVQANGPSHASGGAPAISGDGQIVAFYSDATNLVTGDTNDQTDVFVRLRESGTTEIVSTSTDGTQGNGPSLFPSISSGGRYIAFQSLASNLVPNDTNEVSDIFVRDRIAGTTERVCDAVQGNGSSFSPSISADGSFVAFASAATNLVPGDTNGHIDVFVCDRRTGSIERVSVSTAGMEGNGDSIAPAIDGPGCVVAFKSYANNLVPNDNNGVVDVFVRDRVAGTTERISVSFNGGDANDGSYPPSVSYDGRFVAFGSAANNLVPGDVNHLADVFVRDRQTATTRLADLNDMGQQANGATPDVPPSISGDGTVVGFVSLASNLGGADLNGVADVFVSPNPFSPSGEITVCCQCGAACEPPTMGACPPDCTTVCDAVCLDDGQCATLTPTGSPVATATPTTPGATATTTGTPATATQTATGGTATATTTAGTATPTGATATVTAGTATATPTATPSGGTATPTTTGGTTTPTEGTTTPTAGTTTPSAGTATPTTATPGPTEPAITDCCQCAGPRCQSSTNGSCPAECALIVGAACEAETNCVTFTPTPTGTETPAGGTVTPTATRGTPPPTIGTGTPTATASAGPSATPTTRRKRDDDACNCSISPDSTRRGALLWFVGLLGLLLRSRRSRS